MATPTYAKKETKEVTLLAATRIKKATLNVAKGLGRVQAERVAAAAARNVNAYGQKEEGPSRWQERKEAKRQMYLMSTEKAVKLGVRKDNKSRKEGLRAGVQSQQMQCQRCFEPGHWTFECKNERTYLSRPSHTQKLQNPSLHQPSLELSSTYMEVEIITPTSTSNMSTTCEESKGSKGSKSEESPRRKSDFRNRKRRRSKTSSTESSSSEESPSKSDSESEMSSSRSEEVTSTTQSSSTMSSPSRTSSSSKKSSSLSSIDPPSPESESETRPLERRSSVLPQSNELEIEEVVHPEGTQSEHLSPPSNSPTIHDCQSETFGMKKGFD